MKGLLRIAIVGGSGSGKTTLGAQLSRGFGIPHVELDSLFWGPNWTETPRPEFRERVDRALRGEAWVADGGYGSVRDLVWGRARILVWLDYPLSSIYRRLILRTVSRVWRREVLWNDNRETLRGCFFSRDSLLVYVWRATRRQKVEYPLLLASPEYAHLSLVRLRSPVEADRWLDRVMSEGETALSGTGETS